MPGDFSLREKSHLSINSALHQLENRFRAKKIQEHGEAGAVAEARRNRTLVNNLPQPPLRLRECLKTMHWERQDIRIPEGYGSASIFFGYAE